MDVNEAIFNTAKKLAKFKTSDVVKILHGTVSRQYVSFLINQLVKDNKLVKAGSTAGSFYALPKNAASLKEIISKRLLIQGLQEHEVLDDIIHQTPAISILNENIRSIFNYAFSEMLNNAIDHSHSKYVAIEVAVSDKNLEFTIDDFGIGAFASVMNKRKLKSETEAIQDLLKGKTTTVPHAHSGEGIFFTSKIADVFILESHSLRLRVDNTIPDVFIENVKPFKEGTRVTFIISKNTNKHLNDIFKKFQTDPKTYAFDKTEILIKIFTLGTIYVSRSQAKRVLENLEKFKLIIMDFDSVPTIGQAFADEIFRVFKLKHPDIEIRSINTNEAVKFMIDRVGKE